MERSIIWIDYHPRLYQDLLLKVFEHVSQKRIGCKIKVMPGPFLDGHFDPRRVRVALLSLDKLGSNPHDLRSRLHEDAKLIVFPPKGTCGWVFQKHRKNWQLIYPFELSHMLLEVFSSLDEWQWLSG
jgi:hypothetical protein